LREPGQRIVALPQENIVRFSFAIRLAALALCASAGVQADDEAKAIIAKAIQAHGGEAKVSRPAYSLKLKGTFFAGDQVVSHSGVIQSQGANRSRIEIHAAGFDTISVVDGDKGWIREDGKTRPMTAEELAEAKEDLHTDWVTSLAPLPGKEFTLARLEPAKVSDRPAVGIRVSHKGFRDVDLYFDKETGLLVKKRIKRPGPEGKDVENETVYSGVKDFGGVKSWTRFVTYLDGQKRHEAEITEARFLERLPADTFARP
jgi:hypothetical protein